MADQRMSILAFIFSLELIQTEPEEYAYIIQKLSDANFSIVITSSKLQSEEAMKVVCRNIFTKNGKISIADMAIIISTEEYHKFSKSSANIFMGAAEKIENLDLTYESCCVVINDTQEIMFGISASMKIIFVSKIDLELPTLNLGQTFFIKRCTDASELQNLLETHRTITSEKSIMVSRKVLEESA